jgi:hypothetical protein
MGITLSLGSQLGSPKPKEHGNTNMQKTATCNCSLIGIVFRNARKLVSKENYIVPK